MGNYRRRVSPVLSFEQPHIKGLEEALKSDEQHKILLNPFFQGKGWRDDHALVLQIKEIKRANNFKISNLLNPLDDKEAYDKYIMDLKIAALIDRKFIELLQKEALNIFLAHKKAKEEFLADLEEKARKAEEEALRQGGLPNKEINLSPLLTEFDEQIIKSLEKCMEHLRFLHGKSAEIEKEKVKIYAKVGEDLYQHFENKARENGRQNILKDIPPEEKKDAMTALGKLTIEKKEEIKAIQQDQKELADIDEKIEENHAQEKVVLEEMKHYKDAIEKPIQEEAAIAAAEAVLSSSLDEPDEQRDEAAIDAFKAYLSSVDEQPTVDMSEEEADAKLVELEMEGKWLEELEEEDNSKNLNISPIEKEKAKENEKEMQKLKETEKETSKLLNQIDKIDEKRDLIKKKIEENKERKLRLEAKAAKSGKKFADKLFDGKKKTPTSLLVAFGRGLISRRQHLKVKEAEKKIEKLKKERNELLSKREAIKEKLTDKLNHFKDAVKDTWFKLPFFKNKDKKAQKELVSDVVVDLTTLNLHTLDEHESKIADFNKAQKECHDQIKVHQENAKKMVQDRFEQYPGHENNAIREMAAKIESHLPQGQSETKDNRFNLTG